jgi:hypothetical protein
MKIKKIATIVLLSLVGLVILLTIGLVVWSRTGTYPAKSVALSALESSDAVTVTQDEFIVFTPSTETQTGLVFYPGGLVEPAAYSPILHGIAESGVLVVITPMPLNLAIFDTNAANAAMAEFPQITSWFIAGHSLGGAAAGIYAENNPDQINGLALWDSYPPQSADLSDNDLLVYSIYGTTDGFPNTDNFDDNRVLLPATAQYFPIDGASHAQFGDYGPQTGDVEPVISLSAQHDAVLTIMLEFVHSNQ